MGWLTHVLDVVRGRARLQRDEPPAGQLATIQAVRARMLQIGEGLDPADGLAAFNGMYLRVTDLVLERLVDGDFRNPEFLTRLDIVFACLYLEAVDAARPARAWAPLFETRHQPGRLPIQYALAGMNAHINHDLPIAVVRACRQLGLGPTSPGVEQDYQKVTDLLVQVQEEVRQSFLEGLLLEVDREHAAPVANLVGAWSISRARDAAWVNALVLWRLNREPLRGDFLATLSGSVGMAGRVLLTPTPDLV